MVKVLLVEDDNNLREIFEMRLQAEGYQTLTASDGEEALVVALREKPNLIIADIMMPKMSGFEMLETMRTAPDTNKIKVIMMTALGQAEDQARGEKLGVVKYLVKSQVTLEDFVRVVKEVVQPGESGGAAKSETTPTDSRGPDQSVEADDKTTNNKESEQNMPPADSNAPTNPPAGGSSAPTPTDSRGPDQGVGGGDTNPISGPVPSDDSQMSTADAQSDLNKQVNSFAGSSSAPTSPPTADVPGSPPAADTPVSAPDAPAPGPIPEPPTTPPNPDGAPTEGPTTPTPAPGL